MATPIKSLRLIITPGTRSITKLSPRISPITPSLPVPKSPFQSSFTKTQTTHHVNENARARKNLEAFFKSPKRKLSSAVRINVDSVESPCKKAKNALQVTTPNKNDILQSGLNSLGKLNILGRGTFGVVVRGLYSGKDVAVKVCKSAMITNERNALILDNTNIVKTLDVITKNDQHSIIVMEYLSDAQVLQSIIDNEVIDIPFFKVTNYVLDIVAGLKYIHSKYLLHLDLKPANVLVTNGRCKICDFGSSRFVDSTLSSNPDHLISGTVQYTAPEILTGKSASYASDTYSLGILMWQLRHREEPYQLLECRDTIIYHVVKYGLRPHAIRCEEIEDDYHELYQSCWSCEPRMRPALECLKRNLLQSLESRKT